MSLCSLVNRMGPQLGIDPIKIKVKIECKASSQDSPPDNAEKLILKQPPLPPLSSIACFHPP